MKKNRKSKWILLLACIAAFFTLGGCAIRESLDEALGKRNLTAQVTYLSNGGKFEGTPDRKDMYYKEGSKPLDIGNIDPVNGTATISRNNYDFEGWYYAVLDSNGEPVKESGAYKLGAKVDFTIPLQEGEHQYFVAKWSETVVVNVKLVLEDKNAKIPVGDDGEKFYAHGDTVQSRQYAPDKVVNPGDGKEPFKQKGKGFTFVEYYMDEACTQLVSWPLKKGENQTENAVIYAKYIKGDWTVIRNATNVNDMFASFGSGKKFYLAKNVDASGVIYSPYVNAIFNDEIQGNGYEIKNLKVTTTQLEAGNTISLFGKIAASAKIENLTLSGLTIEYGLKSSPVYAYFAFTSMERGATVKKVALSGKMTVSMPSGHNVDTALYGGYANDEAYLAETGSEGFVVAGTASEVIEIKEGEN